jgi:hypothetical protein
VDMSKPSATGTWITATGPALGPRVFSRLPHWSAPVTIALHRPAPRRVVPQRPDAAAASATVGSTVVPTPVIAVQSLPRAHGITVAQAIVGTRRVHAAVGRQTWPLAQGVAGAEHGTGVQLALRARQLADGGSRR